MTKTTVEVSQSTKKTGTQLEHVALSSTRQAIHILIDYAHSSGNWTSACIKANLMRFGTLFKMCQGVRLLVNSEHSGEAFNITNVVFTHTWNLLDSQ